MKENNSPWLTQLHKDRATKSLDHDTSADVVIVGGGIAGVATLYFLLKETEKSVVLLEGNKIAHGATGHNAGQVVAEFERSLGSLVGEFGLAKAIEGYKMMESAWDLIHSIFSETNIDIPFREFIGYGGYCTLESMLLDLETELIKNKNGIATFPVLIARESGWFARIPEKYRELCVEVEQSMITNYLEIKDGTFRAALPDKKATLNSALFTERLALWCLEQFPDRAKIFESSHVHGIELANDHVSIITNSATVTCSEVVLCTNGFENFYLRDKNGLDIDAKFHHMVQGKVGYMTAYLSPNQSEPMANYFYDEDAVRVPDAFLADPAFYVTRRSFGSNNGESLLAIGGPEIHLVEREIYFREFEVADHFKAESVQFMNDHFEMSGYNEQFFWHGLMGYTRTGVRIVGREPLDPRLMYNLGCNGVGILPSVMGAEKIAKHVNNEEMKDTIFDPKR